MTNTALQRLDRLDAFLREDPDNPALRSDAFDTAMQAGEWTRAEPHLRHGIAHGADPWSWRLKEGHWLIAQRRLAEARTTLQALAETPAVPDALRPVLAHDLAFLSLREGQPDAGLAELAPWVSGDPLRPVDPAVQVLWLRLMHRTARLDEAMTWSRTRWQAGQLAAPAVGIASLIALDANDMPTCLVWSDHALQAHGGPAEAMVARASVALARNEIGMARGLLGNALQHNPTDGRVLSALGFADLLERRLDDARSHLVRAVQAIPDHVGTWHALGWTCLLQGDRDTALQAFQRAVDIDRNFAESHGGLAVVLAARGDREAAAEAIRRALGLDRQNLSGRYAQALLDGEAQDPRALTSLATRLLGDRTAPFGGSLLDLLPRTADTPPSQDTH